jgi:hypothetical protein
MMIAEIFRQIFTKSVIHSLMLGADSQTRFDNDISIHYIRIEDYESWNLSGKAILVRFTQRVTKGQVKQLR